MNTRLCLKIVSRMNTLLLGELGEGADPVRMLAEPVYARDVLLVCDAMRGTELAELAPRFRRALASKGGDVEAAHGAAAARPGFSASRFLNHIFGPPSTLDPPRPGTAAPPARSWFARARSGSGIGSGKQR